ncbi:hypothetical protein [Alteromonas sp. KUL49]|uniref:hypothetical protein n=1 Tax=Alteromonas sp. KUL49 TaxID=2480798 RepID=UPI00102EF9C5|nr:hypothetical protein [Alteromonas sp. KUL49]TAP40694.1 hypothetical protein EYS00_06140 [Alteromonas sp. KUL49]GEA10862.1 hypothetical protein KUL49_12370 [Alteromonas sp. KUL49]
MKSEKELLIGFVSHVFKSSDTENDTFSHSALAKLSLTSIRMVASDALEACSGLKKMQQDKLSSELQELGLPPLEAYQNRGFKEFLKIVGRGKIRKEKELRVIQSLSETTILSPEHQKIAYELLDTYN